MKKQIIFTYSTEAEHQQIIAVLESQGFQNHADERDAHCPKVICADVASKSFYRLNATCCAGLAQSGKTVFHKAEEAEQLMKESSNGIS